MSEISLIFDDGTGLNGTIEDRVVCSLSEPLGNLDDLTGRFVVAKVYGEHKQVRIEATVAPDLIILGPCPTTN